MTATMQEEVNKILQQVKKLPVEQQRELADQILQTSQYRARLKPPPRSLPMDRIVGLLASKHPWPEDTDYKRILEEELMRKYG